jgi:hypothetical protein
MKNHFKQNELSKSTRLNKKEIKYLKSELRKAIFIYEKTFGNKVNVRKLQN